MKRWNWNILDLLFCFIILICLQSLQCTWRYCPFSHLYICTSFVSSGFSRLISCNFSFLFVCRNSFVIYVSLHYLFISPHLISTLSRCQKFCSMMNMELAVSRSLSEAGPQVPSLVNQPSHTVSPEQVTASMALETVGKLIKLPPSHMATNHQLDHRRVTSNFYRRF